MTRTRVSAIFGLVAASLAGLTLIDIAREPAPVPLAEVMLDLGERLILLGAMAALAWAVLGVSALRQDHVALQAHLARNTAQGEAWRAARQAEIGALGQAIEDQFRQWALTEAERDVAGLMLKGASLKEIAIARATSEATIRQQAQAIYRKSGLSGRAELSAYFLESLFETAETATRRPSLSVVGQGPGAA